jgi:regulator of CtrA degradation
MTLSSCERRDFRGCADGPNWAPPDKTADRYGEIPRQALPKIAVTFFVVCAADFIGKVNAMTTADSNLSSVARGELFLGRTYEDTMELLLSARHYVANIQPVEFAQIEPGEQLYLNCEALRMTARLAHVMTWLLVQKAVAAGELTPAQVRAEDYRLGGHAQCRTDTDAQVAASSPKLAELVAQSRRLFERVARLDRQFDA